MIRWLTFVIALVVGLSCGTTQPAHAQGLIWKLPADGTWIRYEGTYQQIESRSNTGGTDLTIQWIQHLTINAITNVSQRIISHLDALRRNVSTNAARIPYRRRPSAGVWHSPPRVTRPGFNLSQTASAECRSPNADRRDTVFLRLKNSITAIGWRPSAFGRGIQEFHPLTPLAGVEPPTIDFRRDRNLIL